MKIIYQLVYRSESKNTMSAEALANILNISRTQNLKEGVTGCLMYRSGYFIQILEGYEKKVKNLYQKICLDPRHDEVYVLSEGNAEKRAFEGLKMGVFSNGEQIATEEEIVRIDNFPENSSFHIRVFRYNIEQLLMKKGFYRPQ